MGWLSKVRHVRRRRAESVTQVSREHRRRRAESAGRMRPGADTSRAEAPRNKRRGQADKGLWSGFG